MGEKFSYSEIKPCPRCGSNRKKHSVKHGQTRVTRDRWYRERVVCKDCKYSSKTHVAPNKAIVDWNGRVK